MSDGQSKGTSNDPRFAKIHTDPKFKSIRQKGLKVKLDDRFSKKDLEIKRKAKVDKYGRKINEEDYNKDLKDFDKYYEKSDEESAEEDGANAKKATLDRARGEVPSDYVSSEDEFTSSDSELSGESELESDVESDIEVETAKPDSGEPSKTLAVVNLDWDNVRSTDLMITFSSFLPSGGKIRKIAIYPSEFGKERMKREEVEGPPKELFAKKKNKRRSSKKEDDSDSDIDIKDLYEEGDVDESVDKRALRQYQLERLRYYYAVIYCSNIETAQNIYNNCDGTEYESTANIFDIRYVPDGMEFDDEPKDQCDSLPKNYKPLQFSTDALQHSNVKLTWDETPTDRVNIAKKAFTQKEIEDMDFKAYLASDSEESEDDDTENAKNKLKALVGASSDFGKSSRNGNNEDDDEGEVDMEITFTPGLEEETKNVAEDGQQEESTIDKVRRKEKERRKSRKQKLKELKKISEQEKKDKLKSLKNNRRKEADETDDAASKSRAELELLMMDEENDAEKSLNKKAHFNMNEILRSEKEKSKKGKYQNKEKIVEDDFKPNLDDDRFTEMFEEHDFAIDPSQPEFKETNAMKQILKERSKRAHTKNTKKRRASSTQENENNENGAIASIVSKLKRKGGKKTKRV